MFKFNTLSDKHLCKVYKVFNECSNISFFKSNERCEKLKTICMFFKNKDELVEWLDEYNNDDAMNKIVVFDKISLICEMAKRFNEKILK